MSQYCQAGRSSLERKTKCAVLHSWIQLETELEGRRLVVGKYPAKIHVSPGSELEKNDFSELVKIVGSAGLDHQN